MYMLSEIMKRIELSRPRCERCGGRIRARVGSFCSDRCQEIVEGDEAERDLFRPDARPLRQPE